MVTVDRKKLTEELLYLQSQPDVKDDTLVDLRVQEQRLSLRVDGRQITAATSLEVHSTHNWSALVRVALLTRYLRLVQDKEVQLDYTHQATSLLHGDGSLMVLNSLVPVPMRSLDDPSKLSVTLPREDFQRMLTATSFAATKNWHRFISGTLLECKDHTLSMVASDGVVLALSEAPYESEDWEVMISPAGMTILKSVMDTDAPTVRMDVLREGLKFTCGMREALTNPTTRNFPVYRALLNAPEERVRLDANREAILDALRLVSMDDDAEIGITVRLYQDGLKLTCGTTNAEIAANCAGTASYKISTSYLKDVITACPSERVEMLVSDKQITSPVLFQPLNNQKTRYVIMPLR